MLNSDFEKQMQQKMEELRFTPDDAVWEKVEAGLPKKKKNRRFVFFILPLLALFCGSILLWNHFTPSEKIANNKSTSTQAVLKKDLSATTIDTKKDSELTTIASTKETAISLKGNNTNTNHQTTIKEQAKSSSSSNSVYKNDIISTTKNENGLAKNEPAKIKLQASVATMDSENVNSVSSIKSDHNAIAESSIEKQQTLAATQEEGSAKQENVITTKENTDLALTKQPVNNQEIKPDSLPVKITDSIPAALIANTKENTTKKTKRAQHWRYGIYAAAGISNVEKGLFKNNALYADAIYNSSNGTANSSIGYHANNPSHASSFSAGLFAEKTIGRKWKFNTGLHYSYQANKILVGVRVDSTANFNFSADNVAARNFYRTGSSESYTNKFHLLQMPLLMQYSLSAKLPIYLEAGATASWLLHSNALQFHGSRAAYFTSSTVFNKLLFSFNAGAGIDLAKRTKFPFSVGYRFSYSLNSATKEVYGKQHLLSSLLYVNIPLKK